MSPAAPGFTLEALARQVRAVAAERPDYIYRDPDGSSVCSYWHEAYEEPGCIFGHALHRMGVYMSGGGFEGESIAGVLARLFGTPITNPDYLPFRRVQNRQDGTGNFGVREPWGACVRELDGVYPVEAA
jgi:hypothetical protein